MEIKGTVHLIEQTQEIGDKGFKKRLLVVKTDSDYNNLAPIDFTKDNVDLLNDFSEGDEVVVSINVGGREYNGKYYASINGWKISRLGDNAPITKNTTKPAIKKEEPVSQAGLVEDDDDSLPF